MKRIGLLLTILALLLCGCKQSVASPIELIKKPRLPEDEIFPREYIYQDIPTGSRLIRPQQSSNLSSISYIDWDGDRQREVYAFYKTATANKVGVIILDKGEQGWSTKTTTEVAGVDIKFADFIDFNDDGVKDLIMGVSMKGELFDALVVYEWRDDNYVEVYSDIFTDLTVDDFDEDGVPDIMLLRFDRNKVAFVGLVSYVDGEYELVDLIGLDEDIMGYYNIVFGNATSDIKGLFLDERRGAHYMTNIVYYKNGKLAKLLDDRVSERFPTSLTKTYQIKSRDINRDGIIEVGNRSALGPEREKSSVLTAYVENWYQWDGNRNFNLVYMRLFSEVDGFSLTLPRRWVKISQDDQLLIIPARDSFNSRFVHVYFKVARDEIYKLLTIEKLNYDKFIERKAELNRAGIVNFELTHDDKNYYLAYYQRNDAMLPSAYRDLYQSLFIEKDELRNYFQLLR